MQQKKQDCKVQQFFLTEAPFNQINEKHLEPLKLHGLTHQINLILTLSR